MKSFIHMMMLMFYSRRRQEESMISRMLRMIFVLIGGCFIVWIGVTLGSAIFIAIGLIYMAYVVISTAIRIYRNRYRW